MTGYRRLFDSQKLICGARFLLPGVLALMLLACAEEPPVEEAVRVVYTPVKQDDVTIYGSYVGHTEASERVEINSRVDGFLEQISFVEGSVVREGTTLYRIDARPYQANLDRVQATLSSKLAMLAKFKRDVAVSSVEQGETLQAELELQNASEGYLALAQKRYRNGVLAYLDVLDARRRLFEAQISVSFARQGQLFSLVDLYKALGGGWEPETIKAVAEL
jgi:multidrug efflux pump subunit AcrA (membrane-fusion protein)